MNNKINIVLLISLVVFALSACAVPPKHPINKFEPCSLKQYQNLKGLAYSPAAPGSCVATIEPYDVATWIEAPYNSHKERYTSDEIGCFGLLPADQATYYHGMRGHSKSLMVNFNLAQYPGEAKVQKAILAVYAYDRPEMLANAHLRGRLNIGDQLQSLGRETQIAAGKSGGGWVYYDITRFAARAINERRNSVSFEISYSCGPDSDQPVKVGVNDNQPRILVEFQ